jgi:hypothetical protein
MQIEMLLGTLTDVYTAAQANSLGVVVGTRYYDFARKGWFIFLMNNAATAITEKLVAVALGTDKSSYYCALAAATASVMGFAGVRVSGADSLAQNYYGWFQCTGKATLVAGSDTTTADERVTTSNQAAGKVEACADTVAAHKASFGEAVTTTASGDVVVMLDRNVWGI